MRFKILLIILAGFCIAPPSVREARACSVPVFRYALERWNPEPYKGIYIYRGDIGQIDRALLGQLKEASSNAEFPLNLLIREVDADSFPEEKLTEIMQGPIPDKLPVLVIWYPGQMGKNSPIWKEKLTPSLVKDLVQSPKRKAMAESLINGESVVWVFMPSGNKKKDEEAKALIRKTLDNAAALCSKTPFAILSGAKRQKLSYAFPILTLLRDDPAEHVFVDMLLKSESDLYEYTDEPMVFPVFGRGRVLGCLFGGYITEKKIQEATAFLSGACSCEVKDLNPGVDLLVAAPWDMVAMNSFIEDKPLPELTGVMPDPDETAVRAEKSAPDEENHSDNESRLFTIYGMSLISVVLVVVIAGFIIKRKRSE